jgi:hypothetical protein
VFVTRVEALIPPHHADTLHERRDHLLYEHGRGQSHDGPVQSLLQPFAVERFDRRKTISNQLRSRFAGVLREPVPWTGRPGFVLLPQLARGLILFHEASEIGARQSRHLLDGATCAAGFPQQAQVRDVPIGVEATARVGAIRLYDTVSSLPRSEHILAQPRSQGDHLDRMALDP